ncbi:MAG: hypothetical protein HQL61_12240 [Magnetococcales bacterium]|nr:hypothetical protein [Nitrospirota bacterium]
MGDNKTSITLKISDADNGRHSVYVNGTLSCHIDQDEVAALLAETRKDSWRSDSARGADIGRQLYSMLNRAAGALQWIVDGARLADTHAHIYLQTPYELTQLPFELLHNGSWLLLNHNIHAIRLVDERGRLTPAVTKQEPLRMLFMACSPTDLPTNNVLDFEKEEERIFSTAGDFNIDMRVEDTGSLEGLRQSNIAASGFDIIHITGHAGFDDDMGPVFYMEDNIGRRRYVQRGVGVLRGTPGQCELKCGLLVRGPAGIGKSCLVGKLVERFKDRELVVFHGVVREAEVIPKLRGVLDKLGNSDGLALLKSDRQYEDKIKGLFRTVFKDDISAIIYFDDFEQNLIRHGNEYYVADAVKDIIRPFLEAVEWTEGNSNVVITSRYQFVLECDGKNLSTEKLVDVTIMSFDGADLNKKKEALCSYVL